MNLLSRIQALLERVRSYDPREVVVELVLIWFVIFGITRFVKGTRAAGALRGVAVLLFVLVFVTILLRVLGGDAAFQRINFLSDRFLAIVAIGLVVVFQPELRRALIRLGEGTFFRTTPGEIEDTVEAITDAAKEFSATRTGAIMVIERQVGLGGLGGEGTRIDGKVSASLLKTIFYPGSALHDLAVVIRGATIRAAGVQLPLADPQDMPSAELGSRHRAAVGVTKETDALVVIVSEETGYIRIAERTRLSKPLTPDDLRRELSFRLRLEHRRAGRQGDDAAAQAGAGNAPPPAEGGQA